MKEKEKPKWNLSLLLEPLKKDDCKTLSQLLRECDERWLDVDNVFTNKRYFLKIVVPHHSFKIYEVDKDTLALVNAKPLNTEMSKQYEFKVWKKADI